MGHRWEYNTAHALCMLGNKGYRHTLTICNTSPYTTRTDCRTAAAIQQRVTAVLRSIPKEAFADSFQKLYERCQPCVVKDDDYSEGQ
jgi:hypothetical protein